jgi:hypothetical protein
MSNVDDLVRRLRSRVTRSSALERSLDWRAADALEQLQAENERLRGERDQQAGSTTAEPANEEAPARVMEPALGLREAAQLLGVSYETVCRHREELGFFRVGAQWRVWPGRLGEATSGNAERRSGQAEETTPQRPSGHVARSTAIPLLSASEAEKELDALIARRRTRKRGRSGSA